MWITNGSIADVAVAWARTDDGIRGFLVPRGTPGFTAPKIHRKLSLRASVTSELVLDHPGCRPMRCFRRPRHCAARLRA
jgi:glutaryl-CoA dehydrogenase